MPRLHVQNISLAFGSTKIVANAGLTIETGKVTALIGANGACGSIMTKTLFGLYRLDTGKTLRQDKESTQENPTKATESSGTFLHQSTDAVGISSLAIGEKPIPINLHSKKWTPCSRYSRQRQLPQYP